MTTPTREELLKLAKEAGAISFSPPPMRAVRGVSFEWNQLEYFAALHAEWLSDHQAQGEPIATVIVHNGAGECRVQSERLCPELPIGMHSLYTAPPSSAQTNSEDIRNQVWNEAVEAAAKLCAQRKLLELADAIRSLKRPLQAQEPQQFAPCYVCDRPMDGLSEDDCHCFHRREMAQSASGAVDGQPSPDVTKSTIAVALERASEALDATYIATPEDRIRHLTDVLVQARHALSRAQAAQQAQPVNLPPLPHEASKGEKP